ncbi:hypothetical protein [Micromonospora sp. NBS 11-29]|uniref:hypothetical protein n=1 Tax=Micromonospora sp. NBS 11-29 TaxID=1960879 RepID=UPI000B7999C5|nr:hypothetical protein [Micromonospora sp. NBS 11-29]
MSVRIRHLAAAALAGVAVLSMAAPAAARPAVEPGSGLTVTTDRLVLNPTDRGYQGVLKARVTNSGTTPVSPELKIVEPVAGSLYYADLQMICMENEPVGNRNGWRCYPYNDLAPGETRTFKIPFRVLTTVRDQAMSTDGGALSVGNGWEPRGPEVRFATLFRSSSGSLRNPVPYARSERPDVTLTAGNAQLAADPEEGGWTGLMPVTIRSANDAVHEALSIEIDLPEGMSFWGTVPSELATGYEFFVPGGPFMPGEERTFHVRVHAYPDVTPGVPVEVTLTAHAHWFLAEAADLTPADNVATVTVTTD